MRKGYYLKSRSIVNSPIMRKPPYVREIWDWLLMNANYTDETIADLIIKRGQLLTSIKFIQESLHWLIGYRKEMYTENQVKKAIYILKDMGMITTETIKGKFIITICNYAIYQDKNFYSSTRTDERTDERTYTFSPSTCIISDFEDKNFTREPTREPMREPPINIDKNNKTNKRENYTNTAREKKNFLNQGGNYDRPNQNDIFTAGLQLALSRNNNITDD